MLRFWRLLAWTHPSNALVMRAFVNRATIVSSILWSRSFSTTISRHMCSTAAVFILPIRRTAFVRTCLPATTSSTNSTHLTSALPAIRERSINRRHVHTKTTASTRTTSTVPEPRRRVAQHTPLPNRFRRILSPPSPRRSDRAMSHVLDRAACHVLCTLRFVQVSPPAVDCFHLQSHEHLFARPYQDHSVNFHLHCCLTPDCHHRRESQECTFKTQKVKNVLSHLPSPRPFSSSPCASRLASTPGKDCERISKTCRRLIDQEIAKMSLDSILTCRE